MPWKILRREFDQHDGLVDIEARARNGRRLDTHNFDGPALVALTQDCRRFGTAR